MEISTDNYQNLILYGTGKCAEAFLDYADISVDNLHVVSSTKNELRGKPSVCLNQLDTNKNYTIVIASQYVAEIYDEINKSALEKEQVLCFLLDEKKVVPVNEYLRLNTRQNTLYAFYDLELNGATFDACVFANAAEEERIAKGLKNICFIVVPPITQLGNKWYRDMYDSERTFRDRVRNLLLPIFDLIPSCVSCIELVDRESVHYYLDSPYTYPSKFDGKALFLVNVPTEVFEKGKAIGHFQAPNRSSSYIKQRFAELESKVILTITIREYTDQAFRNNDVGELKEFLSGLDLDVFFPVIVRDTSHAGFSKLRGFENYFHMPEASLDIGIRCALYEKAHLNFFVNNGVAQIAAFNKKCNYVIFKVSTEEIECTSRSYFKEVFDLEYNDTNYFFASGAFQKLVWQHDSCEILRLYLTKYMKYKLLKEN